MADFDLAIIGGGINGAGLAREAAGHDIRVLLVEQNDLASGTSSASTKLIHGGLRYLELGAIRLVREALAEREVLLRMAPHIVRPMRFVLPHHSGLRAAWQLRAGLFVYDRLAGRDVLPGSRPVDLSAGAIGVPLKRAYRQGFEYSDCWVDDARLVVLNAVDASERGAIVQTRTRCARADRVGGLWRLVLTRRGRREEVTARVLVNASGPWVRQVAETVLRLPTPSPLRLVKGSHIVVRKLFDHDSAYIFQNSDGRIVFAIPYEQDFTLIGTTDVDFTGDPGVVAPTDREILYLCASVSTYFREQIRPEDIVWTFAGVRALYDDGSAKAKDTTRDYELVLDAPPREAPLLTIYGGKITTYRRLAQAAFSRIGRFLSLRVSKDAPWTSDLPLPGGDFPWDGLESLVARALGLWPFLQLGHARRLVCAYGTRLDQILGPARKMEDLGRSFGADLTESELRYLMRHEWAETAEDVLWRRSKLGLHMIREDQNMLEGWMAERRHVRGTAAE
jgi:glycerol-3-phosphate dehydrogenase